MNEHQACTLEEYYRQSSKPTAVQRESMARVLGLHPEQVHSWFQDRRARAKAAKRIEAARTLKALETAHLPNPNHPYQFSAPMEHRTQSAAEASYASLARSLAAAAACMNPSMESLQEPVYPEYDYPVQSPISATFDLYRSDTTFSGMSTPADTEFPEYPWNGGYNSPYGNLPTRSVDMPRPMSKARPTLSRTRTCPEGIARPIPRRSASSSVIDEPARRRRPKMSPLSTNMSRSQSSLGYENFEPYPCDPMTPIRRVTSGKAVRPIRPIERFPPSPISPDQMYEAPFPIPEDGFTPPDTPLTQMTASQENELNNMSGIGSILEQYDLTLDDIFTVDHDMMYNDGVRV